MATAPNTLKAVQTDYKQFETYTTDHGLSQYSVFALAQSSDGLIWAGTQDGINRFDGRQFIAFREDDADSVMRDDYVSSLHAASDSTLWIGTYAGGVHIYDRRAESEATIVPFGEPVGAGVLISDIDEPWQGVVVVLAENGIHAFDLITHDHIGSRTASRHAAPTAATAFRGALVVGFADGRVERFDRLQMLMSGTPSQTREFDAPINAFAASREGTLIAGTLGHGAVCVTAQPDDECALWDQRLGAFGSDRVQDILFDGRGRLWIATLTGLGFVHGEATARIASNAADARSLPHNEVESLMEDRQGNLWIGTWRGLAKLAATHWAFKAVPTAERVGSGGLPGTGIVTIYEGLDSGLLLGSMGAGVLSWDEQRGEFRWPWNVPELRQSSVYRITRDQRGAFWFATMTHGLLHSDGPAGRVRRLAVREAAAGQREGDRVTFVMTDRAGIVWIGTQFGGLQRIENGVAQQFALPDVTRPTSNYVFPIAEDASGGLWVGFVEGGVFRFTRDRTRGRWIESELLGPGSRVLTIVPVSDGTVWIGTQGGLVRANELGDVIAELRSSDGLPNNHVQGILEDDHGYIWVSTNRGLARVDPSSGRIIRLSAAMGVNGDVFYANAARKEPGTGRLLFGGEAGLTIVDPGELAAVRSEPPEVVLGSLQIHGRKVPLGRAFSPDGLSLDADENFFTLGFAATDYVDSESNRYWYKLDPLQEDWVDSGPSGVAHYTSVPSGDYTFRVSAETPLGGRNDGGLTLQVRVATPWYRTVWANMLAVFTTAGILWLLYAYRLQQLKARQALRLDIAGKLHDDIGANLSAIAIKAQMVGEGSQLAPSKQRQIDDVARLARETVDQVRETVWVVNTQYDSLGGLVAKMRDSVETLLPASIRVDFNVPTRLPARRVRMEVRQDMYLAFKEALQNVIKHANASRLEIKIRYSDPFLEAIISDDGDGFDSRTAVQGNGLRLMQTRAARRNGDVRVESTPGAGTTTTIRMRMH